MKYATSFLLITAAITAPLFADSSMPSATQRISNFLSGGPGPNINQTMPATSPSNFSFNGNDNETNSSQSSSSDLSSLFPNLSSFANDHHFDPNSLTNLQSFINNLHLDPALQSKVQMLAQN